MSTPATLTRSRCELSRWMSSMCNSSYESTSYTPATATATATTTTATTTSRTNNNSTYDYYYDYLDYDNGTGPNDMMMMMDLQQQSQPLQPGGDSMDDYFYYCWEQPPSSSSLNYTYNLSNSNNRATSSSALHQLVALHATCGQDVAHFFQKQSPATLSLQHHHHHRTTTTTTTTLPSLPCGATALHVALLRNSYHVDSVVAALLQQLGPQLAATPMRHCQSLPLHIYTAHAVTIDLQIVNRLLAAYPAAAQWTDAAGDTPLSLLWRNIMRFRWAQAWECHEQVPVCMGAGGQDENSSSSSRSKDDASSWMTLITPEQFLACAIPLVRAATSSTSTTKPHSKLLTWHEVCQTPCVPPLLIRMLLWHEQRPFAKHGVHILKPDAGLLEPDDAKGRLPLHWAAVALPCQPYGPYQYQSVVELLLQAEPTAAGIPDRDGHLPLHLLLNKYIYHAALSWNNNNNNSSIKGKNSVTVLWPAIRALVQAYPEALSWPDPTTGLCPALQLATVMSHHHHYHHCCQQQQQQQQHCHDDDDDDEAMDLLYQLLRADPSCLPMVKPTTATRFLDNNDVMCWDDD